MTTKSDSPAIRVLPDDVANKIAAGEVVERPASVVKELVENALDAGATRITVRVVAAGRRLIEVTDDGCGMSEQNALLAIERHATSKVRTARDLDAIGSLGFRGEALASIASVSRFELVTRRAKDDAATKVRVDGGIVRDVTETGAPVGTRVSVHRLYFNTPVRAKFLKGITTELGHCIDVVQRHALAQTGVGFQFIHNDKPLFEVPQHASLRDRVALIWGLHFTKDMVEVDAEQGGYHLRGMIGLPGLTRAQRSHQFFFVNRRPVVNRSLQYGFSDAYRGLVTVGRHPVGILLLDAPARFVDVNIHPTKREVRFRDERAVHNVVRDLVRERLAAVEGPAVRAAADQEPPAQAGTLEPETETTPAAPPAPEAASETETRAEPAPRPGGRPVVPPPGPMGPAPEGPAASWGPKPPEPQDLPGVPAPPRQQAFGEGDEEQRGVTPEAVYEPVGVLGEAPMQLFDTYLLVPSEDRLLIIDQHALHERLNYDTLVEEVRDNEFAAQELAVPIVIEVAPAQVRLVESNLDVFAKLGIELEAFGGNTFQVTAVCHLYDEHLVRDVIYQILDELGQGDLFDKEHVLAEALRLASRACKASVRGGERLTPQERRSLLEGFKRLRPPYTCPHGRPIIVELTQYQMEKSFRRVQ